jgi:hypothetical protein
MTMRLEFPLFMFIVFLLVATRYFELFEFLGVWQYIVSPIPIIFLFWFLFDRLNLKDKRIGNGVGVLILLLGPAVLILFDTFIFVN